MTTGASGSEPSVSLDELERERLRTYIDWAEVRAPAWHWPVYAVGIAVWLSGYRLGPLWGTAGALLLLVGVAVGIRAVTSRSGVTTPRFRGMPPRLKRAFLPVAAGVVWLVAVLVVVVAVDEAPHLLLGVVTGLLLALTGAWTSRLYRNATRRLARETGIGQ